MTAYGIMLEASDIVGLAILTGLIIAPILVAMVSRKADADPLDYPPREQWARKRRPGDPRRTVRPQEEQR